VPESHDRNNTGRIDWPGALLATLGLGGLVFGLIESSRLTLFARPVVLAIVSGTILLVAFIRVESLVKSPMLPLHLFRVRNFAGTNLLTLLLYFSLGGGLFFFTLNLIQVQRFSATAAGAALLPFVLILFSLSRWSGGLLERLGPRLPLTVGPLVAAAGYLSFSVTGTNASYWSFLPGVLLLGLGMAISVAPLTTTVMTSVNEAHAGVASGINNAVARAAGLLAIAVLGVVMLNVFSQRLKQSMRAMHVPESIRTAIYEQRIKLAGIELTDDRASQTHIEVDRAIAQSFVSGFRIVMLIAAVLAAAGALVAWLFIG
jgi:predicted MFS family arabinose efflux permease